MITTFFALNGVGSGNINHFNFIKCTILQELYRLLSEEHHDGHRTVPLENLLVELQAGGLDRDHQRSVSISSFF